MSAEIAVLCATAASIGFIHTILGPDHYLPFVVMSRARKWTPLKTAVVTLLCGAGHVASSVALGLLGIAAGIGVMKLELFEGFRGNIAAFLLIGFGLAYFVWGLRRAIKNSPHAHGHAHVHVDEHEHTHTHHDEHTHVHGEKSGKMTPWILFTIFVFGPCEPLIPILMYPAAKSGIWGTLLVAGVFASVTLATMLVVVMVGAWGLGFAGLGRLERFTHALAGGAICLSGLAIQLLGI